MLQSIREEHAREIQAWKDRLQRELQAQDEVLFLAPLVAALHALPAHL